MLLKYDLPKNVYTALGIKSEDVVYAVPYDIGEDGKIIKDAHLVVTKKQIYLCCDNKAQKEYLLSDFDTIKNEVRISCGILYGIPKGGSEQDSVLICRYSARHQSRYAYIAKGCRYLIEGKTETVESHEYEKVCVKCGRVLPGTRECPHCAKKKQGLVFDILKMTAPYKFKFIYIFVLMLLVSGATLITPEIQKRLIDGVLTNENGTMKSALMFLLAMLFANVLIIIVNLLKSYSCSKLGSVISMDIRGKLHEKIQKLSLSFVDDRKPGDLMNRITRDTQRISDFMGEAFCNLFTVIIILACVIVYMFTMDVKLTLISFIFMPISWAISAAFHHNVHRRFHMQYTKDDKVNSNLRDVLSGMAVVKSYGKEKEESEHFNKTAEEFAEIQCKNESFWAVFFPLLQFFMGVGVYFVTYYGGKQVLWGTKTIGELTQFITYTGFLYSNVDWLTNLPRLYTNFVTSVERISDVMHEEPKIVDSELALDHDIKGDIEFRDVTFGYKTYEPVLENINLKIKAGEMIGLVGASGTGKSTLINLVMHLYDVDSGEILVDGINIKDIQLKKYHSQIGVVLQETFLFSGTILNNIRYARPNATVTEVIKAAKMANAHDFICKTPDGYNTYVGEKGYNLSGGERQRIAIARAILNDPRILILDEATASLDTESEYLIQTALNRLTHGKTTFAIAHRLSTLKNADRLVVIDGHHIKEVGTHNELMEQKGIYYNLVMAQLTMQKTKNDSEIA